MWWKEPKKQTYEAASGLSVSVWETFEETYYSVVRKEPLAGEGHQDAAETPQVGER